MRTHRLGSCWLRSLFPGVADGRAPLGRRSAVLILALLGAGLAGVAGGQVITEFPIPTASSYPLGIAARPDGNLWFTEYEPGQIGRITTAGVVTEFPIPTANNHPYGITAGPDGNFWFTEIQGNQIGRITTAGVVTEFPIPTANSDPRGIAAGPDGNLWFTEELANKIGRITPAGLVTEFPIPTANSGPHGIASGPDGNLWFTEWNVNQIGRITTAGVVTEFPIPTASSYPYVYPEGIAVSPDGNLWFTEAGGNQIGRITTAGVVTEFPIPTANSGPRFIAAGPDGNLWFTEHWASQIGQITTGPTTPQPMAVDAHTVSGSVSNANGVLEPGETVQVDPPWMNTLTGSQAFTGTASNLTGPAGPTYTIDDSSADYGSVNAGAIGDCNGATGDCYLMTVSGTRPAAHWDATFTEDLSANSITRSWKLHIGNSFTDVPASDIFYGFIENLFHNGVTGGCGGGNYCPDGSVTRAQMAVFLMKGKLGATNLAPPATGTVFNDVHIGDFAADWIEKLAGFQVTAGCGNGNYCPNDPVTRAQMAVFLLKAEHGSAYTPPPAIGVFGDVAPGSFAADWIEDLYNHSITAGCSTSPLLYCPDNPNTRGQMAVFLVKTFGLQPYAP